MSERIKQAIPALAKNLYSQGYQSGTSGNISVRVKEKPLKVWITASGIHKDAIHSEDIILVNEDGLVLNSSNKQRMPSGETPIHLAIYKKISLVGCIIHTHSMYSLIISQFYQREVVFRGLEILKGLAGVEKADSVWRLPIEQNYENIHTFAEKVSQVMEEGNIGVLISGHGLFVCGKDILTAKKHVEIIEYLLRYEFYKNLAAENMKH